MKRARLVAVGACSIDTILTVPQFPEEDSKLRATSFTRRRGGNTPNTLEVLQQLVAFEYGAESPTKDGCGQPNACNAGNVTNVKAAESVLPLELFLIAPLPAETAKDMTFIVESFNHSKIDNVSNDASSTLASHPKVDLSHCLYRAHFTEPVSSYVISSSATSSRTIINHNELPEMATSEFILHTQDLLQHGSRSIDQFWFHFEGRIPETTLECIRYLRGHNVFNDSSGEKKLDLKISVEIEKAGRNGLQDLAHEADVIFYSSNWAKAEGYESAEMCLRQQSKILSVGGSIEERLLICAWGASGACAARCKSGQDSNGVDIVQSPAFVSSDKPIVDATGAGDTFIASVLFGLICKGRTNDVASVAEKESWSLRRTLDFANGLAGRKILQQGFRFEFLPELLEHDG